MRFSEGGRLARALTDLIGAERLPGRKAAAVRAERPSGLRMLPLVAARTPFFCSGCPHNLSTRTTEDTLVGVGIGCHAMVALDESGMRGNRIGVTQMGGEGAQWWTPSRPRRPEACDGQGKW